MAASIVNLQQLPVQQPIQPTLRAAPVEPEAVPTASAAQGSLEKGCIQKLIDTITNLVAWFFRTIFCINPIGPSQHNAVQVVPPVIAPLAQVPLPLVQPVLPQVQAAALPQPVQGAASPHARALVRVKILRTQQWPTQRQTGYNAVGRDVYKKCGRNTLNLFKTYYAIGEAAIKNDPTILLDRKYDWLWR